MLRLVSQRSADSGGAQQQWSDLLYRSTGGRWIGELKLRATDQILWDLLKRADALRLDDVTAAFLQVGAVNTSQPRADLCVELL